MPDTQPSLIQDAQAVVTNLLTNKLSKSIKFHTLSHTQEVVAASEKLCGIYQLTPGDKEALILAAWFHDTGYTSGDAKDHESVSVRLANEFLSAHNAPEELKKKVEDIINATRMPQTPDNLLQQIICDADLFHLGTDSFKEKNRLLREELVEFGGHDLSKGDWRRINIRFLENHKYFTPYGQQQLQPVKEKHLAGLKEKDKPTADMKPDKKEKNADKPKKGPTPEQAAAEKAKKEKEKQSERGIATVFRIMAQNQNNLSQMADSKANILISVNAIILSIVLSTFATKLEDNRNLLVPIVLLVVICVATIVFSILATRPNTNHGRFTEEDIKSKRTNLLFFGNFFRMSLRDYDWAMQEMLADKDYLYTSIVKDNYFLGVVLAKKYRLLRYAYNIFMFGLIVAMIAFAIAVMLPKQTEVYVPSN